MSSLLNARVCEKLVRPLSSRMVSSTFCMWATCAISNRRARCFEITHVAHVQNIEDAIGEDKLPPNGAQSGPFGKQIVA